MNISFNYDLVARIVDDEELTYLEDGTLYIEFEKPVVWMTEDWWSGYGLNGYVHHLYQIHFDPTGVWGVDDIPYRYRGSDKEKRAYIDEAADKTREVVNGIIDMQYTDEELLELLHIGNITRRNVLSDRCWTLADIPDKELQQEILKAIKRAIVEYTL